VRSVSEWLVGLLLGPVWFLQAGKLGRVLAYYGTVRLGSQGDAVLSVEEHVVFGQAWWVVFGLVVACFVRVRSGRFG
jgi:hypothetical protein